MSNLPGSPQWSDAETRTKISIFWFVALLFPILILCGIACPGEPAIEPQAMPLQKTVRDPR